MSFSPRVIPTFGMAACVVTIVMVVTEHSRWHGRALRALLTRREGGCARGIPHVVSRGRLRDPDGVQEMGGKGHDSLARRGWMCSGPPQSVWYGPKEYSLLGALEPASHTCGMLACLVTRVVTVGTCGSTVHGLPDPAALASHDSLAWRGGELSLGPSHCDKSTWGPPHNAESASHVYELMRRVASGVRARGMRGRGMTCRL